MGESARSKRYSPLRQVGFRKYTASAIFDQRRLGAIHEASDECDIPRIISAASMPHSSALFAEGIWVVSM